MYFHTERLHIKSFKSRPSKWAKNLDFCFHSLESFSSSWHELYHIFQVTTWDWTRAEKSFTVYEIMCKILKVRQPFLSHFFGDSTPHSGYTERIQRTKLRNALSANCLTLWFMCSCSASIPLRHSRLRMCCSFSAGPRSLWIWSWEIYLRFIISKTHYSNLIYTDSHIKSDQRTCSAIPFTLRHLGYIKL